MIVTPSAIVDPVNVDNDVDAAAIPDNVISAASFVPPPNSTAVSSSCKAFFIVVFVVIVVPENVPRSAASAATPDKVTNLGMLFAVVAPVARYRAPCRIDSSR